MRTKTLNSTSIFLTLFLNFLLIGLFALQFVSFLNTSFRIQEYYSLVKKLSLENEKNALSLVSKSQVRNVDLLAEDLDFEKAQKVEYINVLSRGVAAKSE